MRLCFNTKSAYIDFNMLVHDPFFVDKSDLIAKINMRIHTKNRYICITKPRRFGKTSLLNMLGAYYCKSYDSRDLFDGLKISKLESYMTHLNQYNVINLCLNHLPNGNSYKDHIHLIKHSIIHDITEAYPSLKEQEFNSIEDSTCQSYWTRTGKIDEVLFFLKYNIGEVREDIVKMVNGISVRIDIEEEYSAGQPPPKNQEEIYSAMITYGLLSYHDGELQIPNKELMIEFEKALKDNDFGYVAELVSEKLKKENMTAILVVGINYDTNKKEHQCVIEELL